MKRSISFALFLLTLSPISGATDPLGDVNRSIQENARRLVPILSPEQRPSHKAVYQGRLASILVGLSPNGSPIGYGLVFLVAVPVNVDASDEAYVPHFFRSFSK
jgi:hypothetical protein